MRRSCPKLTSRKLRQKLCSCLSTKQEIEEARVACKVQAMIGHPMDHDFLGMVCAHMIPNCLITEIVMENAK
jgi:hypothetical protein